MKFIEFNPHKLTIKNGNMYLDNFAVRCVKSYVLNVDAEKQPLLTITLYLDDSPSETENTTIEG